MRLGAAYLSSAANLLLVASIAETLVFYRVPLSFSHRYFPEPAWEPLVNSVSQARGGVDDDPPCPPGQEGRGGPLLTYAPLPAGFDPEAHAAERLVACVKVDGQGRVRLAYLATAGRDRASAPPSLRTTIARGWRFQPGWAGWHRVRLYRDPAAAPLLML